MADVLKPSLADKDIDQAITALKKGAYLLKYGRRGKPKFCPFRLSSDETALIWYYGKDEKQLALRQVSKIIPGQRTAIFQRYPRPEKEYQSFSLIYGDRSLDLICKDKDEAEVWFVGLKALIARSGIRKVKNETKDDSISSESPKAQRTSSSSLSRDEGNSPRAEGLPRSRLGLAFADIVTYTATSKSKSPPPPETLAVSANSPLSSATENPNTRSSTGDRVRVSLSSAVSSSSQGSCPEDSDSSGDVFIFGEGAGGGVLLGGELKAGKFNANVPKVVESTMVLSVRSIACGENYAVLVTKHGEVFSWGEEVGGRLGHGNESEVSYPKLIDTLSEKEVQMVTCGKYHSCAVTFPGDLYTWGDGIHNCGLLGHGNDIGHWIPRKVGGVLDGLQVTYVSCGPWHTAIIISSGRLFTFGDGSFGALGHGDRSSTNIPREVEGLKGNRTLNVACGVWHTAAIVEASGSGLLFTWGDGDKGQLGNGDTKARLIPERVFLPDTVSFSKVACGHHLTVALTNTGRVYTMGTTDHGQLGNFKIPICVEGKIADVFVEEIACGSHHVAVLTSTSEVYTWGKGSNGQLGHGDNDDRSTPTLIDFFKNKQVKSVACGSNFTAILCIHKWISGVHNSICSGCQNPFNFRRKRHNCYNCGLAFCNTCTTKKSLKASLAPTTNKPYRVCDDCFTKLQKSVDNNNVGSGAPRVPKVKSENVLHKYSDSTGMDIRGPTRLTSLDLSSCNTRFVEGNDQGGHMCLFPNGNVQRNSNSSSSCNKSTTVVSTKPYWKLLSTSLPSSGMASRSTSPVRGKSYPETSGFLKLCPEPRNAGPVFRDNRDNNSLEDEIRTLRAKVEELANKTRILEEEVGIKSKQLKETTARAADEAEKAKAAKEVIKSLTAQLKEMAEQVPESDITGDSSSPPPPITNNAERLSSDFNNRLSSSSSVTTQASSSPRSEPPPLQPPPTTDVGKVNLLLSNGTKTPLEKSEWIIKDKPGVYITLTSSIDGGNELRRVRFSRKRFTEEQASQWWTEHGTKVFQKYNIKSAD